MAVCRLQLGICIPSCKDVGAREEKYLVAWFWGSLERGDIQKQRGRKILPRETSLLYGQRTEVDCRNPL